MFRAATATVAAPRARTLGLGLIVAAVALLSLFARTGNASAGFAWCADDPIISVNGQDIQVWVNVPSEDLDQVKVARVEFHVPRNADARIVFVDENFFPEKATVKKDLPAWDGKGDLVVEVKIRIDTRGDGTAFPIGAEVIDAAGTTWYDGTSDEELAFTAVAFSPNGHRSRNSFDTPASR